MSKSTLNITPERLEQFRLDQSWSFQRLADEIFRATLVRLNLRTLTRFINRETRPYQTTQVTVNRFFAEMGKSGNRTQGASR